MAPTSRSAQDEFADVLDTAPAVLARSKSHVTLKSEAPKSEAAKSEAAEESVPVPHQVPEVPEPVKPSAAPKVEETWSGCFFWQLVAIMGYIYIYTWIYTIYASFRSLCFEQFPALELVATEEENPIAPAQQINIRVAGAL